MPGLYGITSNANISVYNTVGLYNVGNTNVAVKGNVTVSNTLGLYQGLGNPIILTNAQQLYTLLDESGNVQFALTNSNTTVKAFTANINTPTGTYGSGLTVPVITTSADGRVTNISQVSITGYVGQYSNANVAAYLPVNSANVAAPFFLGNGAFLSGLPASSVTLTGDVTGAGNTGTPFATALSATGVVGGTYGSEIFVPQITVDSKGRVTTIANVIVSPGGYGNSNVAAFLPTYGGTINTTSAFSNAGIALQGTTWSQLQWTNGGAVPADQTNIGTGAWFYLDNNGAVFESNATGTLQSVTMSPNGNLTVSNSVITTYGVFWANGDVYGGSTYGNSNVAAYLASGTDATINAINANITAANATANSQIASTNANVTAVNVAISNLQANVYSNANVAAYLPINSANVAGQFFLGNAFYMTGVGAITYSNANVAAYLPTSPLITSLFTTANTSNVSIFNLQQQIGNSNFIGNIGALGTNQNGYPIYVNPSVNGYRFNFFSWPLTVGELANASIVANLTISNGAVISGNVIEVVTGVTGARANIIFDISTSVYPWFDQSTYYLPQTGGGFGYGPYTNVSIIASQSNATVQSLSISALTANINAANSQIVITNANVAAANAQIANLTLNSGTYFYSSNVAAIGSNWLIFQSSNSSYFNYTIDATATSTNAVAFTGYQVTNLTTLNNYPIVGNVTSITYDPNFSVYTYGIGVDRTIYPWLTFAGATSLPHDSSGYYDWFANSSINGFEGNAAAQQTQINSINANVSAANAQIAINTANISTLFSNAATQATAINSTNANVTAANSAITVLQSNVVNITSNLGSSTASGNIGVVGSNRPVSISGNTWTIDATGNSTVLTTLSVNNLTTVNGYPINGNVTSIAANTPSVGTYRLTFTVSNVVYPWANSSIFPNSSIYANVQLGNLFVSNAAAQWTQMADFQTYANANATTQQTQINSINANVSAANASIQTISANLGAFQTYANSTFGSSSFGNANVAAYLPTDPLIISIENAAINADTYSQRDLLQTYSVTASPVSSNLVVTNGNIYPSYVSYGGSSTIGNASVAPFLYSVLNITAANGGIVTGLVNSIPVNVAGSWVYNFVINRGTYPWFTGVSPYNIPIGSNFSNVAVYAATPNYFTTTNAINANIGAFQTYANATFYKSGSSITVANVVTTAGVYWSNGVAYSSLTSSIVNGASNVNIASSGGNISMFANTGIIDARLTTGAFILPTGANTARPSSPVGGMIRFNSNLGNPEWYSSTNSAWYTFSSNVAPPSPTTYTMTYLVVAGGGGGGAGGMIVSNASVNVGTVYTITVGNGGSGVAYTPSTGGGTGGTGGNSSITGSGFSSVIAIGGGGGGGNNGPGPTVAGSGGSGGGVPNYNGSGTSPGSGTSGQGNAGGAAGAGSPNYPSGGGGGAGAAGNAPSSQANGGNGGNGLASTITGASVTYAGGGGGAYYNVNPGAVGTGGTGGGGAGGNGTGGTGSIAGSTNTGGGGGGNNQNSSSSSAGGSGVVILSVPTANYTGTYTGTVSVSTTGSNTILTFTASGTYTA